MSKVDTCTQSARELTAYKIGGKFVTRNFALSKFQVPLFLVLNIISTNLDNYQDNDKCSINSIKSVLKMSELYNEGTRK